MRGKAEMSENRGFIVGITPAYAGKSMRYLLKKQGYGDHPRLCGEKLTLAMYFFISLGSPPPMRGKANIGDDIGDDFRITPAYAGKSHPLLPPPFHDIGSPPPMRGKATFSHALTPLKRITPAYAGKRFNFLSASFGMGDHPRLCGEKHQEIENVSAPLGSPPPMRGKVKKSRVWK